MCLIACSAYVVWCGVVVLVSGGTCGGGYGDNSSNGWWWDGWDGVVCDVRLYNNNYYNKGGMDGVGLGCGYALIIRALP